MTDIDTILERGLDGLMPSLNTQMPGLTSKILKTESEQCTFPAGRAGYNDLIRFLDERGDILARYDFSSMVAARIRGGFLSMNPALVICSIAEGQVWVAVYAKEGLIKQHTAEKLISKICEEFGREFGSRTLEGE